MSTDDLGPPPADDPTGTGDEAALGPAADQPGPDPAALGADDAFLVDGGRDVNAEPADPQPGFEELFGAGGALELPADPEGDRELSRWLDAPPPPEAPEGLPEFADRIGRRLRGQ
jgi:hypothetical protein